MKFITSTQDTHNLQPANRADLEKFAGVSEFKVGDQVFRLRGDGTPWCLYFAKGYAAIFGETVAKGASKQTPKSFEVEIVEK